MPGEKGAPPYDTYVAAFTPNPKAGVLLTL
jgi:hypothetical protein